MKQRNGNNYSVPPVGGKGIWEFGKRRKMVLETDEVIVLET
jgi:hypothetical protein